MKPPVARKLASDICLTANVCQPVFWLLVVSSFNYFKTYAWSVDKHAVVAAFMLSVVKMLLKEEVRGSALNSYGNYIADHGNHGKIMELCFFDFLWEP